SESINDNSCLLSTLEIFYATSIVRPREDVAYCIRALGRRLSKTRNWIVAIKTLIVIHRTLREGDPIFREELLNYSHRRNILQIPNFKDDSSPLAWHCSSWVRMYALFLEERLECCRVLKYDIEAERLTKTSPGGRKVHSQTRLVNGEELLLQLPALQQLLYRLTGCRPEGAAFNDYLIQYTLAMVLKESFKIYCAINDGIINLVELFFGMSRQNTVKALNIYKRAGKQAYILADFYEFCKGLELVRNFQFPVLRQPPPSFLVTMEEYVLEAPQTCSVSVKRLDYYDTKKEQEEMKEVVPKENENQVEVKSNATEKVQPRKKEPLPFISIDEPADFLGLRETNPKAIELEESNALALAIFPPGSVDQSNNLRMSEIGNTMGWELALVTTPSNTTTQLTERKLAGGFDRLLLDSLYEDDVARRQLQLQNAGYGFGTNPFEQTVDSFSIFNNVAPPTGVQMAMMAQQQQFMYQQQSPMVWMDTAVSQPYLCLPQYPQHNLNSTLYMGSSNPFGDALDYYPNSHGNNTLF
ncbi:putative clathrin assembly protein At5g57200, partial [Impatiens glandulifera]|uniref:putative clathrin assembly protein At5g57200 n=1 Tax=Impatiens glandulifera TaxID=253017 RepID=UPI001FB0DB70